jgi:hypothetical protein
MKHLKSYKIFESLSTAEFESDVRDILLDIEDIGLQVNTSLIRKDISFTVYVPAGKSKTDIYLEVYISRPWGAKDREIPGVVNPNGGYPGNLLFWYEIKDTIIRLSEWYYSQTIYEPIDKNPNLYRWEKDDSPLRFFGSGIEMFIGCNKGKDFDRLGDFISFTNFRLVMKL